MVLLVGGLLATGGLLIGSDGGRWMLESLIFRANDRLALYRNSFYLALGFPITGIGPGDTFAMVYSHFALLIEVPYLRYAHNLLLAVWLAHGLVGLVGFVMLVLAGARYTWAALRSSSGPLAAVRWGAALGAAVALLHGLTDAPQYDSAWPSTMLVFVLLGLAVVPSAAARPVAWLRLGPRSARVLGVLVLAALLWAAPRLLAATAVNIAGVLQARAVLTPGLSSAERANLLHQAIYWADQALMSDPHAGAALARRGRLALEQTDTAQAVSLLEAAAHRWPADQAVRKALGYAYIWNNQVPQGVTLLRDLDQAGVVQQELDTWPYAWRERGRPDLAQRAEQAAILLR